jgi:hypothetical protein
MNAARPPAPEHAQALAGRQSGAVLAVGLVLLAVLTVLAVMGMQAAAVELLMVGNEQHRQRAFEAAEAGIEQALGAADFSLDPAATAAMYDDPAAIEPAPIPGHGVPIEGCSGDDGGPLEHCEYFVRFDQATGATVMPGMDPVADQRAYHFVVDSIGLAGRGARSEHTQSFYVVGPAGHVEDCISGAGTCTLAAVLPPVRTTWRQRGAD